MKVKTIPEKLFVRKINIEALTYLTYLPDDLDLTYSIQFEPKKDKRKYIRGYDGKRRYWKERPESELLQEEEIKNVPISGFVITLPDKVQDPRGFSAIVSNLNEVVSNSEIDRGVVKEDLWYAVDSLGYLALMSKEIEKTSKNVLSSALDLKVGDIVGSGRYHEIYLGKFKVRCQLYYNPKNKVDLELSRVSYNIEADSFNFRCFSGAGSVVSGTADPDTVLNLLDRLKSYLIVYPDLSDEIDTIFAPEDSTREYPSDMFDRLYSADKMHYYSYPFYKIIGSREIACLGLTPACSFAERIKDGIKYDIRIARLDNNGQFSTICGDYVTWNNIAEEISNFSGSWKELLKVQGWMFYGGEDPSKCCYSNPKLFVKMKSGITLTV